MDIATAVSKRDDQNHILESLVSSAIMHEENSRDALHGKQFSDKERFLAIVASHNGSVQLKKGRRDASGVYQVGRSWEISDLTVLESVAENGVVAFIRKEYYWRFNNAMEKKAFCNALNACYFKVCTADIPRRIGWEHAAWKGVWDKAQFGGKPPPQQPQPQIRVPKQRGSPVIDTWYNDMGHNSRYGPGRVSHADLSRRPSRGPNSPAGSPVIPNQPEIPAIPEVASKQRYKPQQGAQGPQSHQNLRSSASQASLRARQQSAYPPPGSSGSLAGKSAPPYPTSPLVGTFPTSQQEPVKTPQKGSRGAPDTTKGSSNASHDSLPRRESGDLEGKRGGNQGVDTHSSRGSQTMPLNLSKQPAASQAARQPPSQPLSQPPSLPPSSGPGIIASASEANLGAATATSPSRNPHAHAPGQRSSRDSGSLYSSAPNLSAGGPSVQRPESNSEAPPPALPSLSPARSQRSQRSHRKQQESDASDASFMSAKDDMMNTASQHVRDGSMHQSISLNQSNTLNAPFNEVPISSATQSRKSVQSFDETPALRDPSTPRSPPPALKKIHRVSPAKYGLSSPRRSKQYTASGNQHSRNPSNVSVSSVRSHTGDDEAYSDLKSVLTQLQFTGDEKFEDLEKKINGRITQASETQVAAVAALDDKLDQLDELLAESIDDCKSLTDKLASVAVNLATIAPQVSSIENKSEGSQVLEMNKRMLVSEIERLLESIQFHKEAEVFLVRTEFAQDDLPQMDANLLKLYRPYQIIHSSTSSVVVGQDLVDRINSTAETFSLNFVAFVKQVLRQIFSSDTGSGLGRSDVEVLRQLYPYTSVVLFTKETNPAAYKKMLTFYEDEAKNHLSETLPPFTITWKRKLESSVGNGPKFSFKPQGKVKSSDEATSAGGAAIALKRGMSVKVGSHSMVLKSDTNKYQHRAVPAKGLNNTALATINSCFDELVDTWSEQIAAQQQVMVNFFHLSSSGGRNFDIYVHQVPLRARKEAASRFGGPPQILEADSSRKVAQTLQKILAKMFASADEQVRVIFDLLSNTCLLQGIYLIGQLEKRLEALAPTNQDYTKQLWLRLREMLVPHWRKFIENQSRFILDTHVNLAKRVGIMPVSELFVCYVNTVEASMKALGEGAPKTRKLVNDSHGQIFRSITQVFSRSSQPINVQSTVSLSTPSEDKEALNFHVTMIENLFVITQGLIQGDNPDVMDSVLSEARTRYRKELEAYIADVEQRPLGRILEFVPKPNGPTPKFKVSTFKKVVTSYDIKELRKNVDALRKRVQKHFGDESADKVLVGKVWGAISADFESKFAKVIALAKQNDVENLVPLTRQEVRETMQSFA